MTPRKCTICGQEYTPTAYNQTRCKECVDARRMRCKICGVVYTAEAYNRPGNRSRCPACLSKFRGDMNRAQARPQSDAARAKAHDAKGAVGRITIRAAQDASKTHPRTAKGSHEHAHAKIYFMRSPRGEGYEVQNLCAFIMEHPEDFPNAAQARKQLYLIARSLREPDGDFRHQYSYFGWTMDAPPVLPDGIAKANAYREVMELHRQQRREQAQATCDCKEP